MAKPTQPFWGEPVQGAAISDHLAEEDLADLLWPHTDTNAPLMASDASTFVEMRRLAGDFTLWSPIGGEPSRGCNAWPRSLGSNRRLPSQWHDGG